MLWDTAHKYKVAPKNVKMETAQKINAEVAQMKCRILFLLVSGSVKKNS